MNDGREMSTWTIQGIEYVTNEGKKSLLRGSAFYRTSSTGKLAFLNNIKTDEVGNISNKEWQWK